MIRSVRSSGLKALIRACYLIERQPGLQFVNFVGRAYTEMLKEHREITNTQGLDTSLETSTLFLGLFLQSQKFRINREVKSLIRTFIITSIPELSANVRWMVYKRGSVLDQV